MALLYALDVARDLGATDLVVVGDSTLVVRQASGDWRCRSPNLQRHFEQFRVTSVAFERLRIRHVRRGQNLAGIALARSASSRATDQATSARALCEGLSGGRLDHSA
ncbi:reverse transcriptase-like protein [Sphingomonas sp. ASY06-1R]|uniref:reverse transcriptase-like protein n=1 Tax=Sphingomonas sp. ASY06-1R TaxID=3445771 RepID=UPI003FA1B7A3